MTRPIVSSSDRIEPDWNVNKQDTLYKLSKVLDRIEPDWNVNGF